MLIVDDVPQILTTVRAILERYGATVTAVGSADDAFEALQRERPSVLLSDLSMPGKGGYWLIGEVRALPTDRGGATPAAALTATSASRIERACCEQASSVTWRSPSAWPN